MHFTAATAFPLLLIQPALGTLDLSQRIDVFTYIIHMRRCKTVNIDRSETVWWYTSSLVQACRLILRLQTQDYVTGEISWIQLIQIQVPQQVILQLCATLAVGGGGGSVETTSLL